MLNAQNEQHVRTYQAGIYDLVRKNWSRPPSARNGMQARFVVELIPTGELLSVALLDSSGNAAFDRSAELAIQRAKRFSVPEDNAVFEANFRRFYFLFRPEDLLVTQCRKKYMPTMQNLSAKNLLQLCQQGIVVMLMLSLAASGWADLDTIIIDQKSMIRYASPWCPH